MNKITTPILKDPFRWPKADNKRPGQTDSPLDFVSSAVSGWPWKKFHENFSVL